MKTIKTIIVIAILTVLHFQSIAQLKVNSIGVIGVATNNPNPLGFSNVKLDVFGNQLISGSSNKIYFGDNQKYIGSPSGSNDLSLISTCGNWMRLGASSGIAFWGTSGAETGSNISYQMFLNSIGLGIGTGSIAYSTFKLVVFGDVKANVYAINSDLRFKKNITQINNSLDLILKLNGKNYEFRTDEINLQKYNFGKGKKFGFIAQELNEVLPELVSQDQEGMYCVDYIAIIPILVEAIKDQQKQIDELKSKLEYKDFFKSSELKNNSDNNSAKIYQNQPNPFTVSTDIKYYIPTECKVASINIYNLSGSQIKHFEISQKGEGFVKINSGELKAGIYLYNLIIDGKEIDTKKMTLTN